MSRFWERLRATFENLSARERILVSAVGVLLTIAVLTVGVVTPLLGLGENAEKQLRAAEQQLLVVKRMRREFDDVDQRLDTVEERIRSGPRGNLRTTLETLARQASVRVESMEPQASPAHDRYRETKVEVGLGGVTLAQAVSYLHQIESAQQMLSVKSLRMRTRPEKPDLLDVSFTVSSFEPL
jgi:type II secretory pathway component PulM